MFCLKGDNMKKKFFGLMVLTLSAFFLVACSNSSSSSIGESLEGKYYGFYGETSTDIVLSKEPSVVIEGDVVKEGYPDDSKKIYKIDRKNKLFESDGETVSYMLKDGVLTLDGDGFNNNTYVKAGSDKYKELKEKSSE